MYLSAQRGMYLRHKITMSLQFVWLTVFRNNLTDNEGNVTYEYGSMQYCSLRPLLIRVAQHGCAVEHGLSQPKMLPPIPAMPPPLAGPATPSTHSTGSRAWRAAGTRPTPHVHSPPLTRQFNYKILGCHKQWNKLKLLQKCSYHKQRCKVVFKLLNMINYGTNTTSTNCNIEVCIWLTVQNYVLLVSDVTQK